MQKECPICGRAFSVLDLVLLEHDAGFQCHHCWNRVRATGPVTPPSKSQPKRTRIVARRARGHQRRNP